jgi:hypothetical protein
MTCRNFNKPQQTLVDLRTASRCWQTSPCSALKINRHLRGTTRLHIQSRRINQARNQACCLTASRLLLPWLILDPEDGGAIFLLNISWPSMDYTELYTRADHKLSSSGQLVNSYVDRHWQSRNKQQCKVWSSFVQWTFEMNKKISGGRLQPSLEVSNKWQNKM